MITYPTNKLQKILLAGKCEQNGTPTPDAPVDIVCNNGVLKVSPNLFNKDNKDTSNGYVANAYLDSNGDTVENNSYNVSVYILVNENTEYYYAIDGNRTTPDHKAPRVAFYNSNKEYISSSNALLHGAMFTTPANCSYLRLPIYRAGLQYGVQLEQGSTITSYMPYGQIYVDGTQEVVTDSVGNTANAERLLAVGDYKDTQEVLTGSITRNVGIKVLDGTEKWEFYINRKFISQTLDDVCKDRAPFVFCSHLPQGTNEIRIGSGKGKLEIYPANLPNITTVVQLKTWLSDQYANGTPVIIVYPLATPTTEQVTPQPLTGNSVTQTAGSIDNLPIESSTIAELKKRYIGDKEVKRVYIGDNLV